MDHRELPERVSSRDSQEEDGASDIGSDHYLAAPAPSIDPRAGMEREEQVRHKSCRQEIPHLPGIGMQDQHSQ